MSELRFRLNVPRAGSAAKLSEQESASQPGARAESLRIRAGSSALDAEQRKRDETRGANTAGFTMRAQNGRIVRMGRDSNLDAAPVADNRSTNEVSTERADLGTLQTPSTEPTTNHTSQRSLAPSLLGTLAGRLNSAVQSLLGTSPSVSASHSSDDEPHHR